MQVQPNLSQAGIALGGVNQNPANLVVPLANLGVDIFMLSARRAVSETNGTRALLKNGAVYQVPALYKLQILQVIYNTDTAAATVLQLAYADSVTGVNLNANPVYEFSATSLYGYSAVAANTWYSVSHLWEVPASKYPGFQSTTTPSTEVRVVARLVLA